MFVENGLGAMAQRPLEALKIMSSEKKVLWSTDNEPVINKATETNALFQLKRCNKPYLNFNKAH